MVALCACITDHSVNPDVSIAGNMDFPFREVVYSVRSCYLDARFKARLAFAVIPLLPPSGSGLVVVTGRLLPCMVDAALRPLWEAGVDTQNAKGRLLLPSGGSLS